MTKKPNKYSHKAKSEIRSGDKTFRTPTPKFFTDILTNETSETSFVSKEEFNEQLREEVKQFENAKGNYSDYQKGMLNWFWNNGKKFPKNAGEFNTIRAALIAKGII